MRAEGRLVTRVQTPRGLGCLAALILVAGCHSSAAPLTTRRQPLPLPPTPTPAATAAVMPIATTAEAVTVSHLQTTDRSSREVVEPPVAIAEAVGPLPESWTLESIEAIALRAHPMIGEARAEVESTRGRYVQAGLPYNPVLQYLSEEIGNSASSGLHSVTLFQQVVTANKLEIAQQVESQEIRVRQARLRIAELRVLTNVRAAFAQAMVCQHRYEIALQIVEIAEKSVHSVESLLAAKEVSKVALLQAEVEAEAARITAANAETELRAKKRALAAAMGTADQDFGRLSGGIDDDLTAAPWEALIAELEVSSPEIAAAGSQLERARWALQLACAQVTPDVTGQFGIGFDDSSDDAFATIGVSVPLPIRNRNQGNIRSARAEIVAATAAVDRTRLSLSGRLADAVGRYQMARQRYRMLQDRVIPNAMETLELSRKAFEAGETDFLQLLTAQRTLFATRLDLLNSLADAKTAHAEIEGLLVTTPDN